MTEAQLSNALGIVMTLVVLVNVVVHVVIPFLRSRRYGKEVRRA